MATLTVNEVALAGIDLEALDTAAGVSGDVFANSGNVFFYIYNGDVSSKTVTFDAIATSVEKAGYGTVSISDTQVTVDAGERQLIGPFPTGRFNNTSGQVGVTYSDVTSVTVAAVKFTAAK